MRRSEVAKLLMLVSAHHGGAEVDMTQVELWRRELDAGLGFDEAEELVVEFYANHAGGSWLTAGGLNLMHRERVRRRAPSEMQIERVAEGLDLSEDEAWLFRREFILASFSGKSQDEARRAALEAAHKPMRIGRQSPSKTPSRGQNGPLTLGDVVG